LLAAVKDQVEGVEPQVMLTNVERSGGLARWQPLQVGNKDLDDETAAGPQVPGGVAETLDLLVLGEQAGDGVVDQVDETELPGAVVLVRSPMDTEMSPLPGLLRSSASMGSDRSNATIGRP
jgi:hypothetical protein